MGWTDAERQEIIAAIALVEQAERSLPSHLDRSAAMESSDSGVSSDRIRKAIAKLRDLLA